MGASIVVDAVDGSPAGIANNKAGLDTISPGWSDLRLFGDSCEDLRFQCWRWFTYQFTHFDVSHVTMNCLMNVMLGIPLEGLHGSLRMLVMFNAGVLGGALAYMVHDAHTAVSGMSGGCYALIGMHLADLTINWSQNKFRKPTAALLLVLIGVELLTYGFGKGSTSHAAHFGGFAAGWLIGLLIGRNLVIKRYEVVLQGLSLVVGIGLILLSSIWMSTKEAPQNVYEGSGWCWARQVFLKQSDAWACVRCADRACVDRWSAQEDVRTVSVAACEKQGWHHDGR